MSPTVASRRLRTALRRAREAVGRTQQEIAEELDWSISKLQRIESGDVSIRHVDLLALGEMYRVGPEASERLALLARAARRRGWWWKFRNDLPEGFLTYVGLEAGAVSVRLFEPAVVPGILQSPKYIEALVRGRGASGDEQQRRRIERALEIRRIRQREVLDREDAPEVTVVLDEAVLYRFVGDHETMAEQFLWLAELARRPHVALRVRPFEAEVLGWHQPFVVLGFDGVDPDAVYLDAGLKNEVAPGDDIARSFGTTFDEMWRTSLNRTQTKHLLRAVIAQYQTGRYPRPWSL